MKWSALVALATAQFVMVLDQSVMNVSISTLVDDFDTTVTTIQAVITFYCLVMAMFMLTGAKLGDIIGRRRAFVIGLVIYGCGSALTAVAPSVAVLTLGWSVLEGVGAALVLPAMAALIAGNFEGTERKAAYAVIGGVAGAGIAIGPILGGWATTELSWRVVFAGEVVLVLFILAMTHKVGDALRDGPKLRLDVVGTVLSASALGLIVFGTLQSSTWGWIQPKDSPIEVFGFSLTLFVIAAGGLLGWAFAVLAAETRVGRSRSARAPELVQDLAASGWLDRSLRAELDPDGNLLRGPALPASCAGAECAGHGNQDAPGVGRDVHRLDCRIATLHTVTRSVASCGRVWCLVRGAVLLLMSTVELPARRVSFAWAMGLLGVGMGLLASQLGQRGAVVGRCLWSG